MGLGTRGARVRARCGLLAGVLLAAGILAPLRVADAQRRAYTAEEIRRGRQKSLEALMNDDGTGARWTRSACATADVVAGTAKAHAEGKVMVPEAVDECLTAMVRQARDGALMALYQDMLQRETGSMAGYELLPQRVMAVIRAGGNRMEIGGGRGLTITPGLAFDVGFSRAYWDGPTAAAIPSDPSRVRAVTGACLAQREQLAACFTAGYVQGAAAYSVQRTTAAR